jgi:hypothetical protein
MRILLVYTCNESFSNSDIFAEDDIALASKSGRRRLLQFKLQRQAVGRHSRGFPESDLLCLSHLGYDNIDKYTQIRLQIPSILFFANMMLSTLCQQKI